MTIDLSRLWAAISLHGEDARAFLHAQLTTDVNALDDDQAQFSAWLTPRGRVIAQLVIFPQDDAWIALTHPSLVDPVVRRLRMFVLRARVTIEPAPGLRVLGRTAPDDRPTRQNPLPIRSRHPTAIGWFGGRELIVRGDEPVREEPVDDDADATRWLAGDIALGIPRVTAATSERHVAHAIGLEPLGGFSYRKGCYPGQEIVARTHYLGRVKRRPARYRTEGSVPEDGTVLLADGRTVGEVLAAVVHDGRCEVLAIVAEGHSEANLEDGSGRCYRPVELASP